MAGIIQFAIDYISSKAQNGRIWLASKTRYKTRYELTDLQDDDLVTKYIMLSLFPVAAEQLSIPLGSVLSSGNFNIDYTPYLPHGNDPRLELNLLNGDGSMEIQYTGIKKVYASGNISQLQVFLPDDGTGHSAFDYVLVIQ